MAKTQNNSGGSENVFSGSMNQDVNTFGMKKGDYLMARNAINQTSRGDELSRVTEQANKLCAATPFVIIGAEHLENDSWVLFSTNNTTSEIGFFNTSNCTYTKLARGTCLGFKTTNLISSVSRPSFDGSFDVYFDDGGLNVSRKFNTRNFPFVQDCFTVDGCITCTDTDVIDCEKLRLESIIQKPCLTLKKGPSIGAMLNGSYTAFIAYLVNGERATDYIGHSNIQSIFSHSNINSSLELDLTNLDTSFDEYELVLLSVISEKAVARRVGIYSTSQSKITLDYVDNDLPVVSLNLLPLITPVHDRSDAMFKVGKYLTRVNPSLKPDFNYQPLANQIAMYWQSIEYPVEYYQKGGINVGFMRDETYPFFIRFIYDTGDKSSSFHIPGRASELYTVTNDAGAAGVTIQENDLSPATVNDIESPDYAPKVFEVYNTATITSTPNTVLPDGGVIIAEGKMGYVESTELYDSDNAIVWNANVPGHPEWDLCGKPIRHHKFPDNVILHAGGVSYLTNHYENGGNNIRIMGFRVDNVQPPVDLDGNLIPGIVGYEILRGSRNGDKTVLFKGMINNMYEYTIPKSISNRKGLYANYPFNDLRPDKYISKNPNAVTYEPLAGGLQNYEPNDQVNRKNLTFHSPDTMFEDPFLEADELKVYGAMYGDSRGYFTEPDGHPRHKFITDLTFAGAIIAGLGYAITKSVGTRDVVYHGYIMDSDPVFLGTSTSAGNVGSAAVTGVTTASLLANNTSSLQALVDSSTGNTSSFLSLLKGTREGLVTAGVTTASIPSTGVTQQSATYIYKDQSQAPDFFKVALVALGNPLFFGYISDGADTFIKLVQAVGAWRQYAVQYQAYCGYENVFRPAANNRRKAITDSRYLDGGFNKFGTSYLINHKYRNKTVVVSTKTDVLDVDASVSDVSRPPLMSEHVGDTQFDTFLRRAASHYVAFKTRNRNQYGQLEQIVQLPASYCMIPISETTSGTTFGGDIYIGKYSEKNTLYYFDQWLNGEPDGAIHNYFRHKMFEHTAFWMDTDPFDIMEFTQSISTAISAAITSGSIGSFFTSVVTPSDKHCFDRLSGLNGIFLVKKAFMYLFQSGVRDFFVESEFNIDYRDWQDTDEKKHWPVLSDLKTMFGLELIRADNYYQFDRSLAVNYLAQQKFSWGVIQDRDYNPVTAALYFKKKNKRLLYSLPQETSQKKDNYGTFLPLNYKDFTSEITCIKPIGKTGALILFKNEAPGLLPGVDTLQTDSGTKVTIGDGSLFAREMQRLDNSESSFQYGACANRLSVINTPIGIFYMDVYQGNIFVTDGNSLKRLGEDKFMRWLNLYLPYKLLKQFPDYDILDNPVVGIGCQSAYMPDTDIVYFCKKDYVLKPKYTAEVDINYIGNNTFRLSNGLEVKLGDPLVFDSASWTISWDIANNNLLSYHDWHPDLIILGSNKFHTTKRNQLWKHNDNVHLFCNYYGIDYPFEIEFAADFKLDVNIVRNIEYYLESFLYADNGYDRFHVLNNNFNKAVISNSEQVSGVLRLNHDNGKNPEWSLKFPIINPNSIDILFFKEENKYRFNQFWDITKDRGEFSNQNQLIWLTEENGYVKSLNVSNLDYNKKQEERKSFRHNNHKILLIRENVGNTEIAVNLALVKTLKSPR